MRMTGTHWKELKMFGDFDDAQIEALKAERVKRAKEHVERETLKHNEYVFDICEHMEVNKMDMIHLDGLEQNELFDHEKRMLECTTPKQKEREKAFYIKRKRLLNERFSDKGFYTYSDIVAQGFKSEEENRPYTEYEEYVLYMFYVMKNKRVVDMCKNLSNWLQHATSWEDIYQDVSIMINRKPDTVNVLGMFPNRVKQLANNSIRKVVSFYRRFNHIHMGGNERKIMQDHLCKGALHFAKVTDFWTMLDMDINDILEPEEKQIFELFYKEFVTMSDINKIMAELTGKPKYRCDRKKESALEKVQEWFINTVDSYYEKHTEKMELGNVKYDGNINLSKYGTYKGNEGIREIVKVKEYTEAQEKYISHVSNATSEIVPIVYKTDLGNVVKSYIKTDEESFYSLLRSGGVVVKE